MRYTTVIAVVLVFLTTARALTPRLDESSDFFAGEWSGNAAQGGYCYLNLRADGHGWVLIDAGSGDWLGARIDWHNQRQAVAVEKITPLPNTMQLRVMPVSGLTLTTEFNRSLALSWGQPASSCQLQKIEAAAQHLMQARALVATLRTSAGQK